MFAKRYIEKNILYPEFIPEKPDTELGIIVVIPCFREPDILQPLSSLLVCNLPDKNIEVIIVVNHSESTPSEIIHFNQRTYNEIQEWANENNSNQRRFYPILPDAFPKKYAGAGMARKTGMDEAIRRFNQLDKNDGLIVSLDADTLVDPNYLTEIEKHFNNHPKHVGATLRFQHRIDPSMDKRQIKGIHLYEKYMHYYKDALDFSGFPYAMHTIGSAFCVQAEAYTKQGGMNRKQAGEDFYFLHKLTQLGKIGEITSTCVYPSARLSDRVPFGTGPVLKKWLHNEEDLNNTYSFQAFIDLKAFFDTIEKIYGCSAEDYSRLMKNLPASISAFLQKEDFEKELEELNKNSSNLGSFTKRFFQKFNAFRILKFMNYSHENHFSKENLSKQISLLKNAVN